MTYLAENDVFFPENDVLFPWNPGKWRKIIYFFSEMSAIDGKWCIFTEMSENDVKFCKMTFFENSAVSLFIVFSANFVQKM